jgi:hypothetical protein
MKTQPTARLGAMLLGAALTGLTLTVAPASAQPATNLGKATPMTMQHDLAARAKAIYSVPRFLRRSCSSCFCPKHPTRPDLLRPSRTKPNKAARS